MAFDPGPPAGVRRAGTTIYLWSVLGLGVGLVAGLVAGLARGLSYSEIEVRVVPNEGIRRSAFSALLAGVGFGIVGALFGAPLGVASSNGVGLREMLEGESDRRG